MGNDTSRAWYVYFSYGYDSYGTRSYDDYVRCVRGDSAASAFTDNGDGTVTDGKTGLMWQQEDDGNIRNWEAALNYCESLTHAGASDWRLPNLKELSSIVDRGKYNPAIDTTYFPNTNSRWYWSSTVRADYTSYACYVYFRYGNDRYDHRSNGSYVRCVRGG